MLQCKQLFTSDFDIIAAGLRAPCFRYLRIPCRHTAWLAGLRHSLQADRLAGKLLWVRQAIQKRFVGTSATAAKLEAWRPSRLHLAASKLVAASEAAAAMRRLM